MRRSAIVSCACFALVSVGHVQADVPDSRQISRDLGAQHGPAWPIRPANESERAETFRTLREIYERSIDAKDAQTRRLGLSALAEMGKVAVTDERLIGEAESFFAVKMEGFADASALEKVHLLQSLAHTSTPEGAKFVARSIGGDEETSAVALSLARELFTSPSESGSIDGYRPNWEVPLARRKRKDEWKAVRAEVGERIRMSIAARAEEDPLRGFAEESLATVAGADLGAVPARPTSVPPGGGLDFRRTQAADDPGASGPAAGPGSPGSSKGLPPWAILLALAGVVGAVYTRSRRRARK